MVNDPLYSVGALKEKAQKYVYDVGVMYRSFRDTFLDVRGLEFETSRDVDSRGERALLALDEAQKALWEVAGFELPDSGVEVRPRGVRPLKGTKGEKKS